MSRAKYLRQLRESKRKEMIYSSIITLLIFISIFSVTYGYFISRENVRIREKIENYNPDLKVFYLKQDIERGNY